MERLRVNFFSLNELERIWDGKNGGRFAGGNRQFQVKSGEKQGQKQIKS
jgi:hypothetical protein